MKHFNQLSTEAYIKKCKKKYDYGYDYSKVEYTGCFGEIIITCNKHGDFRLKASNHLNKGTQCPKCRVIGCPKTSFDDFVNKANIKHDNKYIYKQAKNVYINSRKEIPIKCPLHGIFYQTPKGHMKTNGCSKCGYIISGDKQRKTTEEFITRALKIHNGRYGYKSVDYLEMRIKVDILCEKHGIFSQLPYIHLKGHGCPTCSQSKGELIVYNILNDLKYKFKQEYMFEGCRDKQPLPFDFYIPSIRTAIEYQGKQHYEPVCFGGCSVESSLKVFEMNKSHDAIKRKYCQENNINLIKIPYTEIDNISEILLNIY